MQVQTGLVISFGKVVATHKAYIVKYIGGFGDYEQMFGIDSVVELFASFDCDQFGLNACSNSTQALFILFLEHQLMLRCALLCVVRKWQRVQPQSNARN